MICWLTPDEWQRAREVRLLALADAPDAFGSSSAREQALSEAVWRERLTSSRWCLAADGEGPLGLAVHGREGAEHALLSMWVAPRARGSGTADALVGAVLDSARAAGAARLRLQVVEGNRPAERLYARHGFIRTGTAGALPGRPRLVQAVLERPLP